MRSREANVLILCKTYPSPSTKYTETSCVAGMEEDGSLIRLFPVPFRLISEAQQFKKWQWIKARIEKTPGDRRPESHRIYVDTIELGDVIDTQRDREWSARRSLISPLKVYDNQADLEKARLESGTTLGLVRVSQVRDIEISKAKSAEWTEQELTKLLQAQAQGNLFEEDRADIQRLEKIPYDFYYHYECDTTDGPEQCKHKIVDWEVCALYRKLIRSHGEPGWRALFRQKLLETIPQRDLFLLMGTMHRFPGQWLIVSLIYPPKQRQHSLF